MKNISDKDLKKYQDFLEELRSFLDPALVSIETHFQQCLILDVRKLKIIIIPKKNDYQPITFARSNLRLVFDEDFSLLKKLIKNKKVSLKSSDGVKYLQTTLTALGMKSSKKEIKNIYDGISDYEVKKAVYEKYDLPISPDKEALILGKDEIRSRFLRKNPKITSGDTVKITDSSALLINWGDRLSIDIAPHVFYRDDKFIYLDKSLIKLVKTSKSNADTVISSPDGSLKYKKTVLKKNVDLSKVKKIKYKSAHGMIFYIKKEKGVIFLENKKGEKIHISHPDLLISFI